MVLFKTIDYYVQLLLIVGSLGLNLFFAAANQPSFNLATGSYFIVGGWQVCSVIANFLVAPQFKVKLRKIYLVLLGVTLFVTAVAFLQETILIGYLVILLFWAPVMAIIYLVACYRELKLVKPNVAQQQTNAEPPAG